MKRMLLVIVIMAFSTNLASPFFPVYGMEYGLATSMITLIYAIYAFGVLAMLLIGGSFAERFGARPVAIAGTLLAAISALLFVFARGPVMLVVARLVGGVAVGTFMGTGNTLLLSMTSDHHRARIMGFSSALNLFGFGLGPAIGGLWLLLRPHDTGHAAFLLLLASLVLAVVILGSVRSGAGDNASNRDKREPFAVRLGIPHGERGIFWGVVAPSIFAGFGFGSLAFSLLPGIANRLIGGTHTGFGGLLIFAMTTAGAAVQLLGRPADSRHRLISAFILLLAGTWITIGGEWLDLPLVVIAGVLVQGAGNGWTFQVSFRLAADIAVHGDRVRVMSTYFVCGYLGLSVPALLAGALAGSTGLLAAVTIVSALLSAVTVTALVRRLHLRTAAPGAVADVLDGTNASKPEPEVAG